MKLANRIIILVIVFIVLSAILGFASTTTLSPQDASALNSQANSIQPTTAAIFLNNVQISLLEFIPVFGPAFAAYTSYSTGLVFAAIAQSNSAGNISGLESFFILLITPIYWMEFFSYSLAVEESIAIIISIKNRDLKIEWKWALVSILVVISVLFVSARLEASLVNLLR